MFVKNIKNVDCKNMSKNILLILHSFKILLNKINKAMFDFFTYFPETSIITKKNK